MPIRLLAIRGVHKAWNSPSMVCGKTAYAGATGCLIQCGQTCADPDLTLLEERSPGIRSNFPSRLTGAEI